MRILTAEAMREVDRRAIEIVGVPGMVLMENAAIGVVDAIAENFPEATSAAILCGPGNNGGDGLAVLRHLASRGWDAVAVLAVPAASLRGDAAQQLAICRALGLAVEEAADAAADSLLARLAGRDLVLDALFGTGLTRPLDGRLATVVERLAHLGATVVAVDLPSGLDAGQPEPIGPAVRAALTVTFAAPKIAHLLGSAAAYVGQLVVADLGVPADLVEDAPGPILRWSEAEELAGWLPARTAASHKGDHGHLLVVAGSPGKAGAAILAARAGVRSGAGLVTAAVPLPLLDLVDGGSLESMTVGLAADPDGAVGIAAGGALVAALTGKTAVAVGPGLGQGEGATALVRELLRRATVPLLLDADAINVLANDPGAIRERSAPTVLTPHPGELARLLGSSTRAIVADRLAAVREAAERTGAVVVLKGDRTLVAAGEEVWVNGTGNPGMATGGSGDVLTGLIGGLLAQGMEATAAAVLGVHLHGLAGDLAAAEHGETALAAGDLVRFLPSAFRTLSEAS